MKKQLLFLIKQDNVYLLEEIMENTEREKVLLILKKWKPKRGALIMALHEIQGVFGYVPWEAALLAAQQLNTPVARLYEVLTFYNYFKLKTPGKYIISICDGTACHIKGGNCVLQAFEECLGVPAGNTTKDGLFFIQVVRCLGCCGLAPVVVINGKTYGKVEAAQVPQIIAEWRKKEEE